MNDPEYEYIIEEINHITHDRKHYRLLRKTATDAREVVIPWSNEEEFKAILALMDPKPMQHRFFY
jgi:hypothetical protein